MIIHYTPEELRHIEKIKERYAPEYRQIEAEMTAAIEGQQKEKISEITKRAFIVLYDQQQALDAYSEQCQQLRFQQIRQGGTRAIIENAKTQAPLILEQMRDYFSQGHADISPLVLEELKIGILKNDSLIVYASTAASWLKNELRLHFDALKDDKDALQELLGLIVEAVESSPYTIGEITATENAEEVKAASVIFMANMPMYHSKVADALALLTGKDAEEDTIADRATFRSVTRDGSFEVTLQNFSALSGNLGINTHKLLMAGIAEYTRINNYSGGASNPKVVLPLEEYARLLGYKVDERETDSPEAAAKEKKRAAEAMKKAKSRIRQDLELLQAMRWTWQEKVRGKGEDFDSILLLERVAIRSGYIIMEFGQNMAAYLRRLPLTQYPKGLLMIDARKENAYRLGLKISEHYNNDNNQIKGTANRLKVSTLLAASSLPTLETLQNEKQDNSRQWYTRIKEPFEAALDELTGKVISNWEYTREKGKPLTDKEAYKIADYYTFTELYVQYTMQDAPDHKDRLERRATEKKRRAAEKKAAEAKKANKRRKLARDSATS